MRFTVERMLRLMAAATFVAMILMAGPKAVQAQDALVTTQGTETQAQEIQTEDNQKTHEELQKQILLLQLQLDTLQKQLNALKAANAPTFSTQHNTLIPAPIANVLPASILAGMGTPTSGDVSTSASTSVGMATAQPAAVAVSVAQPPVKAGAAAPFSDADWTWLNGNPRTKDTPMATKYFVPEIRADINYNLDFNHPADDTIGGSSEIFRAQEVQIEQLGVGGDFLLENVHARFMTQYGMYSVTTPRNDGSPARGQWDLANAYRYLSEAYGGYHWDKMHGINLDAGIFMSYIGLFSYYNFDNWAYQPSFVSSNTPWFFNGVRAQFFPTAHLKIEPWFINGWQSYGRFNSKPGLGGQIKWTPTKYINVISNNYGYGEDSLGNPNRSRLHTDNSIEVKYYDKPVKALDKMAVSLTGDAGCETGDGVSCHGNSISSTGSINQKQSFLGWMLYNRFWFDKDRYALTIGGGQINNPGRYLVLLPPINGATAITGTPYFTENPGDQFHATDGTVTYDYMPSQYITFRTEYGYRHAKEAYWTGRGGITPPGGTTSSPVGNPADYLCLNNGVATDSGLGFGTPLTGPGSVAAACGGGTTVSVGALSHVWFPDLRRDESKITFALMVKF
jgi:hypothetical protein